MPLLLPTDGCPNCVGDPVHPHKVKADPEGSGIFAYYRCPVCRLAWMCGWSADAASLPCPGCPSCNPRTDAA